MFIKITKITYQLIMSNETDKEIPDISEVDFDTRLKVLLGVSPERKEKEITVYEESESTNKFEDNNNG